MTIFLSDNLFNTFCDMENRKKQENPVRSAEKFYVFGLLL